MSNEAEAARADEQDIARHDVWRDTEQARAFRELRDAWIAKYEARPLSNRAMNSSELERWNATTIFFGEVANRYFTSPEFSWNAQESQTDNAQDGDSPQAFSTQPEADSANVRAQGESADSQGQEAVGEVGQDKGAGGCASALEQAGTDP